MKSKLVFFNILIVSFLVVNPVYASKFSYDALVGKWHSEKEYKPGVIISADVQFNANHTFDGTVSSKGRVVWVYSGNVELKGDRLTWTYKKSSIPAYVGKVDKDTILSIGKNSYTYKPDLGGVVNKYYRVK